MAWTTEGNSAPDPFTVNLAVAPHDNLEVNGLTRVNPLLVPGRDTLNLVVISDSLLTNTLTNEVSPTVYYPTNTNPAGSKRLQMGTLWGGAIYMAEELFVGSGPSRLEYAAFNFTSAHCFVRLGDDLLNDDHVDTINIWSIGVGGATAALWAAGGDLNHRIKVTGRHMRARGLDAATTAAIICLGTNDSGLDYFNGTSVYVPAFGANMQSVIDTCRANYINGPILLDRATWVYAPSLGDTQGGLAPGTNAIITHLNSLVAGNANVFHGANLNAFDNSYRVDNVHPNFSPGLPAWSDAHKAALIPHL